MSKASELKARLIKIIYDEWFKIIVGGVIIAVISFYLPFILSDRDDVLSDHDTVSISVIPENGLLLGKTYIIKPNTDYSIDAANFYSGTVISYNWKDVSHTTRTNETNQVIALSKRVVNAKMAINSGKKFMGEVSLGRPFSAGYCNLGGLIMHLMDEPVPSSNTFKIKLQKKSCAG